MYPKTPLKNLITITTGKLDANAMVIGGKYPFFTCAREFYQIDDFAFDGESILVAGNGDLNVKYYNGKFNAYQRTYVLQNFKGIDGKYLYYVIEDNLALLRNESRGSTIKYIRLGDLQNMQIPLPPLPTQHLIVSEIEKQFTRLEQGLLSLRRAKENLKKYKASVLKSAVEGKLTEDFRNNPPNPLYQGGTQNPHFGQDDIQNYPPCERGAWGDLNNSTEIFIPYNTKLKERAKELRKNMTEPEKKIWYFLKQFNERNNNYGLTILRQKPLDNFIVDFYISKLGLVIEIDGDSHFDEAGIAYDIERTQILEGYGLKVLRFTNEEVINNFSGVCEKLEEILINKKRIHLTSFNNEKIIPLTPFHKGEYKDEFNTFFTPPFHKEGTKEQLDDFLTTTFHKGEHKDSFLTPPGQRGHGGLLSQILEERKKKFLSENPGKKYKEPEGIKQEDLPNIELPEGWEWCNLEQITTLITDGKHGNCVDENNSGYYFLSAKDVKNGKLIYENSRQINKKEFLEVHNRTNLEPGDICLVNTGATVGKIAIAEDNEFTRKTTFQKSVAVIKVLRDYLSNEYITIFLREGTQKLLKLSGGTAVNNLLLSQIKSLKVPLPPLSEQNEIVKIVESKLSVVEKLEKLVDENIKRSENLKQSILKKAFEGELIREK